MITSPDPIPKLGYVRTDETAADQRYVDEDIFFSQHSRKTLVECRLYYGFVPKLI